MERKMSKPVNVLYKFVDGAHFFVSNDEATAGLCVAHGDVKKAYESVGTQLSKLFKMNHGEDLHFEPSMSVDAFIEWLEVSKNQAMSKPSPGVAGMIGWGPACENSENLVAA